MRKWMTAALVSLAFFIVPALGNLAALEYPQLWVLLAIGIAAQILQPAYKPVDTGAPAHDRLTATQIVWSVYLTQLAGIIEAVYLRFPGAFRWDVVTTASLLVVLMGLAFRSWSIRELGRFFTWHITVQPGQTVVTTGPYRIVRHPGYSGALFMYTFTLVFLHAWVTAAIAPLVLLVAFARRIRYEEDWLKRHLGEGYVAYSSRVPTLIPFLW